MSNKPKKKRNKTYTGVGAKQSQPQVIRIEAVKRSRAGQWWHDNKRYAKIVASVTVIVFVIGLVIVGIFQFSR